MNSWTLDITAGLLERENTELIPDEINERVLAVALSYKNSHEDTEYRRSVNPRIS